MNEKEMKELQDDIWCSCEKTDDWKMAWIIPNIQTYNSEVEGISLLIQKDASVKLAMDCLKVIIERRKLKIMQTKEGYVVYSPRKLS